MKLIFCSYHEYINFQTQETYPKVLKAGHTKTTNKKKHYECGMCAINFIERELLHDHLVDFHHSEENNTPHYCLICDKGYCSFKMYQDHLAAEKYIHGYSQIQVKISANNWLA